MTNRNEKAREELKKRTQEAEAEAKPNPEQVIKDREFKKELNEHRIRCMDRELDYKKAELLKGVTETRVIEQAPGQPAVAVDGFVDGLKPRYAIENEVDALEFNKARIVQELEDIRQMEEKNKD